MLSLFPNLFAFSFAVLFLIRIGLSFFLIREAYQATKKNATFFPEKFSLSVVPLITLFLLLGLFTQAVAIVALLSLGYFLLTKKFSSEGRMLAFLMILLFLVLLSNGPGIFAIDLPL